MLKLFRTARFLFGMLAVLSLLLLPSLSPSRTMASPRFLDPTSADKADDDHGGSSSSLGDADKADDDHGGSSSSLGDADKADDDHGGSSSSLGDADESTTGPPSTTTSSSSSSSDSAGPKSPSVQDYDSLKNCSQDTGKQPTSIASLTYFNCGHVKTDTLPGGEKQVTREFTLIVKENHRYPSQTMA